MILRYLVLEMVDSDFLQSQEFYKEEVFFLEGKG